MSPAFKEDGARVFLVFAPGLTRVKLSMSRLVLPVMRLLFGCGWATVVWLSYHVSCLGVFCRMRVLREWDDARLWTSLRTFAGKGVLLRIGLSAVVVPHMSAMYGSLLLRALPVLALGFALWIPHWRSR